MANKVLIKRSGVQNKVPTTSDLDLGELAVNTYDGKLFLKKDDGVAAVVKVGGDLAISSSAPSSPNVGQLWWDSSDGLLKVYYDDGNSKQWVDAAAANVGAIDGGSF